jgi:hypothetical protein
MAAEGFDEMYVHMATEDVMVVVRQNPRTMEAYTLVVRSAYRDIKGPDRVSGVKLPGVIEQIEFIAQLTIRDVKFTEDPNEITGLKGALEVFSNLSKFGSTYSM